MCGRYTFAPSPVELEELCALIAGGRGSVRIPDSWRNGRGVEPRYNVAPTQVSPVIAAGVGDRDDETVDVIDARWGLVPSWAKDEGIGSKAINARIETAHEKPMFRSAWSRRRCVVPITGFFEWKRAEEAEPGRRRERRAVPHYVRAAEEGIVLLAGLWERWQGGEAGELLTFTLLTTEATGVLSELHHRMPVRLERDEVDGWLHEPVDDRESFIERHTRGAWGDVTMHAVSRAVNNPANEGAQLIDEVVGGGVQDGQGGLFG